MAWYRHPGVLAGAALAVVLLAALAVPLLSGSGERESGLRIDRTDGADADAGPDDDATSGRPAESPRPPGVATTFPSIAWPFERAELVVFVVDDVDADERNALVEGLVSPEAGGQTRLLDAAQLADRVGEAQAARLRRRGVGEAVLVEVPGGDRAGQAAEEILPTHDLERFRPKEPPAHPYEDSRIAGTILPGCRELARGAALAGTDRAQALLDEAGCGDEHHVIAAGPQAEEPWVVTSRVSTRPVSPGPGTEDPRGPEARGTVEVPCVTIFTVRVASDQRCADRQNEGFHGLVGTRWDRNPPVLGGMAPEGTDRVTAAGDTLALAEGPGNPAVDAPLFAGPLAPGGEAVELRALAGQGQVLEDRAVKPRDLLSLDRPVGVPGPHLPRLPGPAFHMPPQSWVFEDVDEAVILMDGADQAGVEATQDELERDDAVTDVERLAPEEFAETVQKTGFEELPDPAGMVNAGAGLRATTTSHDEARWLATLAQRHEVFTVYAPTCDALPPTALATSVDHANGLLADAGCDDVTVLDAGDEPPRLVVALVDQEHACTFARAARYGLNRTCRPRQDGKPLLVGATNPSRRPLPEDAPSERRVAHGLAPAAAATVELRAGEQTVTVEPVPVADGLGAYTALLDAGGTVQATARDAAGEVLAEADSRPH